MTMPSLSQRGEAMWMHPTTFASHLLSSTNKRPLLKQRAVQETLTLLSKQSNLEVDQLLVILSDYLQLNELPLHATQLTALSRLARLSFIVKEDKILPIFIFRLLPRRQYTRKHPSSLFPFNQTASGKVNKGTIC